MSMSEYYYAPTDLEDEMFLSEVPVEILEDSIRNQFDDPSEYRKRDYVQSFITKYEVARDNTLDDDMQELEDSRIQFINFIQNIFEEKLGVGFANIDYMGEEDQNELIHLTYRFVIKNIKKNFVNAILNYIDRYKSEVANR